MSQTFKLFRLQQLDTQIDRCEARLKAIQAILDDNAELRQAEAEVALAEATLTAEQKALRQAEEAVRAQRIKIEQTEASLYGGKVRNPKELQDLQNEAAALKRYLAVLEDRQLEAMLLVEDAEAAHQANLDGLEAITARLADEHSDLTDEQAGLRKDIANLQSERNVVAGSIPPDEMSLYEQLRKIRRGVAVAKVTDRACAACGGTLSAALLHAARSPSQISRCETCGRILYGG